MLVVLVVVVVAEAAGSTSTSERFPGQEIYLGIMFRFYHLSGVLMIGMTYINLPV